MIGKLTGIIDTIDTNHILLDVQGVGYVVHASSRTLSRIGGKGDPASLLIEMQVREDSMTLYGFAESLEQHWFKLLTSVQGVGAKAGLSILAVCPADRLAFILASGDKAAVQAADGVGPKLATRIVTELKDKASKMDLSPKGGLSPKGELSSETVDHPVDGSVDNKDFPKSTLPQAQNKGAEHDAVSALINLGYGRSEAYEAVLKARNDNEEEVDLSELIRQALQELSA